VPTVLAVPIRVRLLDPQLQLDLRRFAGHAALLVLCCAPALLIDKNAPVLFLSLLGTACRFTALFLFIVGFSVKRRTLKRASAPGIIVWHSSCSSSDAPSRLI
jgi:hypothetical protein